MLWTVKYRPRKLSEVIGNRESIEKIRVWAENWSPSSKPLLLVGPPGVGKTASVYALSEEFGFEIMELNASDDRSKERLAKILGGASETFTFSGKRRLILVDEVDGVGDARSARALAEILQKAKQPIILTANDAYAPSLSYIKPFCNVIQFKRVNYREIASYLAKILQKEGIEFEEKALLEIARRANGDVRSAILDIQAVAEVYKKVTFELVEDLGFRDREANIFNVLGKIFKSEKVIRPFTLTATLDVDPSMLKAWIVENVPREYEDPEEIAEAFDWISKADIFDGRIVRRQYWGFMAYSQELLINGVIVSKKRPYRKFVQYSFPSWVKTMAKYKDRREKVKRIARKIGKVLHMSQKEVMENLPFIRMIMSKKEWKEGLVKKARLEEDEIKILMGE